MKKQTTHKIISDKAIDSYINKNRVLLEHFMDKNHLQKTDFEEFDALVNKAPLTMIFSGSYFDLSDYSQSHLFMTAFKSFDAHFSKFNNVKVERFLEACDFRRYSKVIEEMYPPKEFPEFLYNLAYWVFHEEHNSAHPFFEVLAEKAEQRMNEAHVKAEQELLSTMIATLPATQSIHTTHKI